MRIRDEQPGDAPRITEIQYAAFKGHPRHPPGAGPFEHHIVEKLRASGALTLSLLAELDGQAVGHIALSPAAVGQDEEGWLLLGPVGVLPEMQGRGVGSALVREALARMRGAGASGVVLVGDPGYYARFGFLSLPGLGYPGVPGQYVLAVSFGGNPPQGDIAAHEAFDAGGH
ncbi:GNAT family N-acetyltransferase [Fundidesulfovibrio agrisoli]|uniref:GNAT family N-acetyltransferase n=1 Tax=Fundidesulfovibrio agrisoli TaxID=2922717 RepID=UPI001FAC2583|nr:N-acetyltransferase [Fundidesulfovibrio agrisoli]